MVRRAAVLVLGWLVTAPPAAAVAEELRVVSREEMLEAMRRSVGFELTATANGPRLEAEVVLRLVAEAEKSDPLRRPLFFGHREWFLAFLERTGLSPSQAPVYARLPDEMGQELVADYRRERVIGEVLRGPQPVRAVNVRIYWEGVGKPDQYSYEDELSVPKLHVTQKRLITYRLVDYGDRLWYAEVQGLRGRPTSGALGALFALIGEASVVESRAAAAPDGTQVVRGHGRKWWFDRTETVTLLPSGRGERGVPPGRPDLLALEKRLEEPLAIRFQPQAP
ncbi:MAG TPA: hypothetical protein VEQ10_09620 [Vicinamibacteria bacterium]|nr:hypothetical protein [Vicinamibacteria bacterium]